MCLICLAKTIRMGGHPIGIGCNNEVMPRKSLNILAHIWNPLFSAYLMVKSKTKKVARANTDTWAACKSDFSESLYTC